MVNVGKQLSPHLAESHLIQVMSAHCAERSHQAPLSSLPLDVQHGFRKDRSYSIFLISTVRNLVNDLDKKQQKDIDLLDFQNHLIRFDHQRLLLKSEHLASLVLHIGGSKTSSVVVLSMLWLVLSQRKRLWPIPVPDLNKWSSLVK